MEGGKFNMSDVRYILAYKGEFIHGFSISRTKYLCEVDLTGHRSRAMTFSYQDVLWVHHLLSSLGHLKGVTVVPKEADYDV